MTDAATAAGDYAARPASLQLVERWAGFAKAISIYPPTNDRVLRALNDFVDQLETRRGEVTVRFARQRLRVDDEEHELVRGTNPAWLDERIQGCGLEGVEFRAGVDRGALIAFTRRLLDNYAARRHGASFEGLWPSSFAGLRLLPRRFDSGFGGEESEDAPLPNGVSPEQYRELVELLLEDEGVLERLDHLRAGARAGEEAASFDVIGQIVSRIPVDTIQDPQSLVALTRQTLDSLSTGGDIAGRGELDDEGRLSRFLVAASQKLFAREAGGLRETTASAGAGRQRGHARDDEITDDLEAFQAELEALPYGPLEKTPPIASVAEQLGVYLHYLLHLESDEQARRMQSALRTFLAPRRPEALEVLKQYLELLRPGTRQAGDLHVERLSELLGRLELSFLLRDLGIVTADQTVASFPEGFCTYVDALDLTSVGDRDELNAVCTRIGSDRIRAAAKHLVSDGLLENDRARRLLDIAVPSVMPLASVVLEKGRHLRSQVIDFLRKLKLDAKEACLLRVADTDEYFPREYLAGLLNPGRDDRASDAKLRQWTSLMLCRYLRDHRTSPAKEANCIYALKHLPDFWSEEAERVVTEIARPAGRSFFSKKSAPSTLRSAAQETARTYGLL